MVAGAADAEVPVKRVPILLLLLLPLAACSDDGDTIILDGLDCGLVRADLTGDWVVTFVSGSRTLVNCDDPALDGTVVDVTSIPQTFSNVLVVGSGGSAGFQVVGNDASLPHLTELIANVEADSCLALVTIWEGLDDDAFFQCIGTFDLDTLSIAAFCDSAEIDPLPDDGLIGDTCDLNASIAVSVDVFP